MNWQEWNIEIIDALYGPNDPSIPNRVPVGKRAQWVRVFNSALSACQREGGQDCEGRAFRMANGVIKEGREDTRECQEQSDVGNERDTIY